MKKRSASHLRELADWLDPVNGSPCVHTIYADPDGCRVAVSGASGGGGVTGDWGEGSGGGDGNPGAVRIVQPGPGVGGL
jgi:hypothetical protein